MKLHTPSAYPNLPDNDLSELIKIGDELAFSEFFKRHYKALLFSAYRVAGDHDLAQDAVQTFFIEFWHKKLYLTINKDVKGYAYKGIRYNSILAAKRKKRSLSFEVPSEINEEIIAVADATEEPAEPRKIDIPHLFNLLPGKQIRRVAELYFLQRLKRKQVAELMGISDNTVKTHISMAVRIFRRELGVSLTMLFLVITLNHILIVNGQRNHSPAYYGKANRIDQRDR